LKSFFCVCILMKEWKKLLWTWSAVFCLVFVRSLLWGAVFFVVVVDDDDDDDVVRLQFFFSRNIFSYYFLSE
jgi:hypothetical protein